MQIGNKALRDMRFFFIKMARSCLILGFQNQSKVQKRCWNIAELIYIAPLRGTALYFDIRVIFPPKLRLLGEPYDHTSDIWSFGLVLFAMVEGHSFFLPETTIPRIIASIMSSGNIQMKTKRNFQKIFFKNNLMLLLLEV